MVKGGYATGTDLPWIRGPWEWRALCESRGTMSGQIVYWINESGLVTKTFRLSSKAEDMVTACPEAEAPAHIRTAIAKRMVPLVLAKVLPKSKSLKEDAAGVYIPWLDIKDALIFASKRYE
jgi:hypothetical protein